MFEMPIIRSQHLHKAFFLSPTSQTSQPAFVLGIKVLLPFLALPASFITANAVLPTSAISTTPLAPVPVLHQPFMVGAGVCLVEMPTKPSSSSQRSPDSLPPRSSSKSRHV